MTLGGLQLRTGEGETTAQLASHIFFGLLPNCGAWSQAMHFVDALINDFKYWLLIRILK